MNISQKPYLIRAIYEWSTDSGLTPHVLCHVDEKTSVPMQYVQNDEIVLNVGERAVQNLKIDNDWIHFSARFSGKVHEIWVPVGNVKSIFARETGEGMGFELEPMQEEQKAPEESIEEPEENKPEPSDNSFLKIIK